MSCATVGEMAVAWQESPRRMAASETRMLVLPYRHGPRPRSRPAPRAYLGSRRDRARTLLDQRDRVDQHVDSSPRFDATLGEVTAERTRTGHAMEGADEMPRDRMQPRAGFKFAGDIGHHGGEHVLHAAWLRGRAKYLRIDVEQPPWLLVGRAPEHDAIDMRQVPLRFGDAGD